MNTPSRISLYEKAVAILLVLAFAACGWGPFIYRALSLPFTEIPALFAAIALTVLALGLVYEAAERLLEKGRGIYAAAVFCSLPATGMIATEPGSLSLAGTMTTNALALWLTSRARGDDRPYFLAMLGVLLVIAGYFYGLFAGNFALLASIGLAVRSGSHRRITAAALFAAFAAGVWAHHSVNLGLPILGAVTAPEGETLIHAVLPWLPWTLWILPALLVMVSLKDPTSIWRRDAAGTLMLVIVAAAAAHGGSSAAAAAVAPVLAMLAADLLYESFTAKNVNRFYSVSAWPGFLTGGVLLLLPLLSALGVSGVPVIELLPAGAAILLAAGILWTSLNGLPRWIVPFLFGTGLLFGKILDTRDPILREIPVEPASISLRSYLLMLAAAGLLTILLHRITKRRFGRVLEQDCEFRFGGSEFRLFNKEKPAKNAAASAVHDIGPSYSFVIFGDVTGAESPFSTRRGGYFVFRSFVRLLRLMRPQFAISLGDLASQATNAAYSKLFRLASQLPIPIMVTPGNHDLFSRDEYNAACFHELFGADNAAFQIGSVQYILLNNAWGSIDPSQFAWLESTLKAKTAPFTLVFCHKPPFEPRENEFYAMEERPHADRLHELFKAHRVTAVFSGHIHTLLSQTRDGVTYIVSGGGGSKLIAPDAQHHFLQADVTPREIALRALPITTEPLSPAVPPLLELRFTATP